MSQTANIVGILIVAALLIGAGWQAHSWKTDRILQKQIIKAKEKEREQDANSYQIAMAYSDMLATLDKRLRDQQSLSRTAVRPQTANGAKQEQTGACTDTFYRNGLEDVVKLEAWQDWARKQGIPLK